MLQDLWQVALGEWNQTCDTGKRRIAPREVRRLEKLERKASKPSDSEQAFSRGMAESLAIEKPSLDHYGSPGSGKLLADRLC